jgi:hypothetical protein
MAYRHAGGTAANGFAPHNLTVKEARALHHARYPASPHMRLPSGWHQNSTGYHGAWDPMVGGDPRLPHHSHGRGACLPAMGPAQRPCVRVVLSAAVGAAAGATQPQCHHATAEELRGAGHVVGHAGMHALVHLDNIRRDGPCLEMFPLQIRLPGWNCK